MAGELARFATGGATRPDGLNFDPAFSSALAQMFAAAPAQIQSQLQISSGYRSPQRQAELFQQALAKYGSEAEARRWVAPPGHSNHNHGYAADLKYLSPDAQKWAHENAGQFGLAFPLSNENWHVELAGRRGGGNGSVAGMFTPGGPAAAPNSGATARQPVAGTALAEALPGATLPDFPVAIPTIDPVSLTALNLSNQFAEQKRAEKDAEERRRVALFSGPGVAGMFG